VDYLDEALPGSFRQAQVCFSSLIPKAVPTCDAVTMEPFIWLYCDYGRLKLSNLLESEDSGTGSVVESRYRVSPACTANAMGRNSAGRSDNMLTPNVLMLTKHTNGSLNLWQVTVVIYSLSHVIVVLLKPVWIFFPRGHLPGKPGKVREFDIGREIRKTRWNCGLSVMCCRCCCSHSIKHNVSTVTVK